MIKSSLLLTGLLTLIFNPSAHAYSTTPCGWQLDLEAFYAKATDTLLTNSIYAVKVADPSIQGDFKELYHRKPDSSWAGSITAGYDFPSCASCNYGIALDYTFLHHTNSDSVHDDGRNSHDLPVLAPAEFIDITDEASARFANAHSKLSQQYDTLDLLAHKKIFLCHCTYLKFFSGIRYFHLKEQLNNHYSFFGDIVDVDGITNIYNVNFSNEINAVGPHIGTRVSYYLASGFSITGQLAGSLLYGDSKSQFHNNAFLDPNSTLGEPTDLTSNNHHGETARVIPALSGKVGLSYQTPFVCCTSLVIEAGYRGEKYFNAADDVAYQQLLAGDDINSNSNYHDFDLSGPYFSLSFHS